MTKILVPVVKNEKAELFELSISERNDFRTNKAKLLLNNEPNSQYIKAIANKFERLSHNINFKNPTSIIEGGFTSAMNSARLGIYLSLEQQINKRIFKNNWDAIIVTGNLSEETDNLEEISYVKTKYQALIDFAGDNSGAYLYIYVSNDEVQLNQNQNIKVVRYSTDYSLNLLKSEIFEPLFDDTQHELLKKTASLTVSGFYETETYLSLKKEIKNYNGYLIEGRSNSGKSILASALAKYSMEIGFCYAPVWITINNNEVQNILTSHENNRTQSKAVWSNEAEKNMNLNGESSRRKNLENYLLKQIKVDIQNEKKYVLIIDNIEFDFVDDILRALNSILINNSWIGFSIITSWNKSNNQTLLHKLNIKQVSLSKVNEEDFHGIFKTIIDNQFTSNFQKAEDNDKNELENRLYQLIGDKPGEIQLTLSALDVMSVKDLVLKLEEIGINSSSREAFFYTFNINQLGLFAQIVLFVYLDLFGCKNKPCNIEGFSIILEKIRKNRMLLNDLLSLEAIEKAIKQIESHYLIYESIPGEYSIKNDVLKYLLFSYESDDSVNKIKRKCITTRMKGIAAIRYGWDNELFDLIQNNYNELKYWLPMICAESKNIEILKAILRKGLGVNDIDKHLDYDKVISEPQGWGAIHYISRHGSNPEFLGYIFANYDNINLYTKQNISILHLATVNENVEMLKYILEHKYYSSIDEVDNIGTTAFNYALRYSNSTDILDLLESYGCNKHIKDNYGANGLFYAVINENIEILKYVIEKKWYNELLEINNDGINCFTHALQYCSNLEVIKYLEMQSSSFISDKNRTLSLTYAARNDNPNILEYFIKNYPIKDINELVTEKDLIFNALHAAAFVANSSKSLEILLAHGADINKKAGDKKTIFHLGLLNPSIEVNKFIFNKLDKTNLSYDEFGYTPIHIAYRENPNIEIIKKIRNKYVVGNLSDGTSLLHLAVKNENIEILKYVLVHHIYEDINQVDNDGLTCLHIAALSTNNTEILDLLLRAGADPYLKTKDDVTLLMYAVNVEKLSIVKYIIKKKLFKSIDEVDSAGFSALHYCILYNKGIEIIQLLCENGSDFSLLTKTKESLLHLAVDNENIEIIEYLLRMRYYSDINAFDESGFTPLHLALMNNSNVEVIKLLIAYGADYKIRSIGEGINFTSLMIAAGNINKNILEYVIKNKLYADINETSNFGTNALFVAARFNSNLEVLKYLIKLGVRLESSKEETILHSAIIENNTKIIKFLISNYKEFINRYNSNGYTPIQCFVYSSEDLQTFDFLINNGANVNLLTKNENLDSLLHLTVTSGKTEFVEYLLKNELVKDINENNNKLETPLHQAFLHNEETNILEMLLKYGADFSQLTCEGNSILHLAATNKNQCVLEYIFANKLFSDIDLRNNEHLTPLLFAASGNEDIKGYAANLILLVEKGANLYAKDKKNATILHCAAKNKDIEILKTIVEKLNFEDIEAVDEDGKTALHYAAEADLFENFKYLFHLCLDPYQESYLGDIPIKLVPSESVKKYNELISLLC